MKTILKKIGGWAKENRLVLIYAALAVIIEGAVVSSVEGSPFVSRPFLSIGLLVFFCGLLLVLPDNRSRLIVGAGALFVQTALDLIFAAIYDMTGQYFDFGMFSLRNDAVSALEKIPINFVAFYVGFVGCVMYIIYGLRSLRAESGVKVKRGKYSVWYYVGAVAVGVATFVGSVFVYYPSKTDKYKEMVYGKEEGVYSTYGMIGNFVGEIANAMKKEEITITREEAEAFLYAKESKPTKYFGVSKDKNVVVMLSESFEWFSFVRNEKYPYALDLTDEELARLYPNLTKFYNESVVATNFHSREKTDISETISIMGAYPTDAYVNYDYYENAMPNTMGNILKTLSPDTQMRYFHNGEKEFYNRDKVELSFGFESVTDRFDMEEMANETAEEGETPTFINYKEKPGGELCLDSEMIETCKDEMFPTDKRFYTYITTITMHGTYFARENLQAEREAVAEVLGDRVPNPKENSFADVLFHYMVTAKEFDDALGVMMEDLKKKDLLDDTVVLMFGDHNAYYNQLSNYVKDIVDYDTDRKFSDLYNVPLMIYDSGLEHQVIDKFACTADIVPTLLDLLGVRYYENFYYGNSLFSTEESVLYSRAYGIFLREGIVGTSATNIVYRYEGKTNAVGVFDTTEAITQEDLEAFYQDASLLVEKIKYCDYIFQTDYFAPSSIQTAYREKMKSLNGKE